MVNPGDYLSQPFQAKKKDTSQGLDQLISDISFFFFFHFLATPHGL